MRMILKEDLIILHGSFVFLNQLGSIRKINMVHFFMNNTTKINEKCLNEILLDCCALHQESEWLALKLLYMLMEIHFYFSSHVVIAGIRPASRCWLCWNFDKLEPPNIKQREEMMNREKNKKSEWSQTVATWIPPPIGIQIKKNPLLPQIF